MSSYLLPSPPSFVNQTIPLFLLKDKKHLKGWAQLRIGAIFFIKPLKEFKGTDSVVDVE